MKISKRNFIKQLNRNEKHIQNITFVGESSRQRFAQQLKPKLTGYFRIEGFKI